MSPKNNKLPIPVLDLEVGHAGSHVFKDTDPQMLFAIWDMENGLDPEKSLEAVENAVVVYDKFRQRLSRRLS